MVLGPDVFAIVVGIACVLLLGGLLLGARASRTGALTRARPHMALVAALVAAVALMLHGAALVAGSAGAALAAYLFLVFFSTSLVTSALMLVAHLKGATDASGGDGRSARLDAMSVGVAGLALVYFGLVYFWEAQSILGMVSPLLALLVALPGLRLWTLDRRRPRIAAALLYLTALAVCLQLLFCLDRGGGRPLWLWSLVQLAHTLNVGVFAALGA